MPLPVHLLKGVNRKNISQKGNYENLENELRRENAKL